MPPEILYPTKTLRYNLCEFFVEKRIDEPGLGGPISVRLQEMENLLEYAQGNTEENRIESLGKELSFLNKEWFGPSLEREVINITGLPISENFILAFRNNEAIEIRCLSKNIEDYVLELKTRTQAARRHYGLAEVEALPNGGIKIISGENIMKVGKSRNNDFNLSIKIVKLMHGEQISKGEHTMSLGDDYNIKDFVAFYELLDILNTFINDPAEDDDPRLLKAIKDVVDDLNVRALEKLGSPLFEINTEGLKWIL